MNYQKISYVLLFALLCSCATSTEPSGLISEIENQSIKLTQHPLTGKPFPTLCNDPYIGEQSGVEAQLYPVYVDYSESVLKHIEELCGGPYAPPVKKIRKDVQKESVEVAFFKNPERAKIFQDFLKLRFPSAEIGSPVTIESPKDSSEVGTVEHIRRESSRSFPAISSNDLNRLKSLVKRGDVSEGRMFEVALPTYLPNGFVMDKINIAYGDGLDHGKPSNYEITYRNKNSCFYLQGDNGQWGGDPRSYRTLNVVSPALGNIRLDYYDLDRQSDKVNIFLIKKFRANTQSWEIYSMRGCEDGISLSDIVKIIKSIKFISDS
jgi:hypothetical protein